MKPYKIGDIVEWTDPNDGSIDILEVEGFRGTKVWFTNGCWLDVGDVDRDCKLVSEAKPAAEKRKVLQINPGRDCIWALCDDSTIWCYSSGSWSKLPDDIPQDEEGETGQ
jgi:hypothetical protein